MIARKLLRLDPSAKGKAFSFSDHMLLTGTTAGPYDCPPHIPGLGILAMLSGSGRFTLNCETLALDPTHFLLIDRGSRLSIHIPDPDAQPVFLFFRADTVTEAMTRQQADFCWLERLHPVSAVMLERLQWLVRLGNNCSSFSSLKANAIIGDILVELVRQALDAARTAERLPVSRPATRVGLYRRLSVAREWMEANYPSPISIKDIAATARLNDQHFLRMFRDCFGITPHQYLIDVRLEAAQRLLAQTEEPVSTICRQTGFDSLSSFSGLFRQRFGVPPSTYRERQHEQQPGQHFSWRPAQPFDQPGR